MGSKRIMAALVGGALMGMAAPGFCAERLDIGKREYGESCAACHGANGKGGGSFAQALQLTVPDLTLLARNNGGVFPVARVYEVIDGREDVKAHGTREMPIWGKHFSARATPEYDDYPHVAESFTRARILAVIDYLYRIQAK